MKPMQSVIWILVVATFVLLLGSFTGMGTGLAGSGMMTHMVWSYLLVFVIVGALLAPLLWSSDEPQK